MLAKINFTVFKHFFQSGKISGLLLLSCVIISLFIANSGAQEGMVTLLAEPIGIVIHSFSLTYSVAAWINDGLMAIFFLMVGLEIKRELIEGELSTRKKAALPILAAVGGMILPALLFFLINRNAVTVTGWGIPMATDIAFAL